jgi:hypothetical protein
MPSHIHSVVDPDGAVVLDIQQNVLITLNTTGAYIWSKLQAGKTVDEIIAELSFIVQLINKTLVNH